MQNNDWYIINEVHRTKNITKAANNLYMSQPALTKRLHYLEDKLQVRILNRSNKGVQFTKEGEFLAAQAQEFIRFWNGTSRKLDELRESGYGVIRIVSAYTYNKYYLPEIIQNFRQTHPHIAFDIQTIKSNEITQYLEDGRADVVFVRGLYNCDLEREFLLREQAYLISANPIDLNSLFELDRVDSELGNYTRSLLDRWWNEYYGDQPSVSINVREADTCWQMVKRGLGYTIGFFGAAQLQELGVHYIPLFFKDGMPVERTTWFLYSKEITKSDYIREFIAYIHQFYGTPK